MTSYFAPVRWLTWVVAEPLTEEQLVEKEELIAAGFEDWSRRDFQQFVRALETYGWYVLFVLQS